MPYIQGHKRNGVPVSPYWRRPPRRPKRAVAGGTISAAIGLLVLAGLLSPSEPPLQPVGPVPTTHAVPASSSSGEVSPPERNPRP
jgi:hypothetical protein